MKRFFISRVSGFLGKYRMKGFSVVHLVMATFVVVGLAEDLMELGCQKEWKEYKDINGKFCYKLFQGGRTFLEAESLCHGQGGHVTSIHSIEEYNFIEATFSKNIDLWVGLYREGTGQTWTYTDLTRFDFKPWKSGRK